MNIKLLSKIKNIKLLPINNINFIIQSKNNIIIKTCALNKYT